MAIGLLYYGVVEGLEIISELLQDTTFKIDGLLPKLMQTNIGNVLVWNPSVAISTEVVTVTELNNVIAANAENVALAISKLGDGGGLLPDDGTADFGKLLQKRATLVRTKLDDYIEAYKKSNEYLNLSNTQRKTIDRKIDKLEFGNVATADVNISGIKKEFNAHSQIHSVDSIGADVIDFSFTPTESERIFKNYVMDEVPRYNDTEAKILEDIASKIKDPNIEGEINLFSELDTCQSCTNIILEFRAKYPNIKLNIYTNNTITP